MIEDRGFQIDTCTWFYAADPPTLIFGDDAGTFIYGPAGIFAKTFDVIEKSEGYYLLGAEAFIQDSIGREIHVVERWEMFD
ncbi:hypothetical protein [Neolewinella agarilytica]|uniref:Uncharacterized protein n=1 Tax=Neolewinella agarilytica TaxID=478744 RepID=A0A1H9M3Y7_9BACT|nr:hypothetical protein [Neolewinella agarilytica]SER18412.1 hypothetical protein SAMN05444359_1272 [Neolewinella agarilytica]